MDSKILQKMHMLSIMAQSDQDVNSWHQQSLMHRILAELLRCPPRRVSLASKGLLIEDLHFQFRETPPITDSIGLWHDHWRKNFAWLIFDELLWNCWSMVAEKCAWNMQSYLQKLVQQKWRVVCTDYLLFQPCVAASFEVMHRLLQNHQCSMHHPTLVKSKREVRRKLTSTAKFAFECSA